jgi:hypothetical protein
MASTIKVDNVQNQPGTDIIKKCGTTVTVGAASDNIRSAGNNLQASDGGNLISQSGTDITLGASGDTINLASGASQSGFGRTGTVDWVTTPKVTGDSPVTAATGSGYFLNTTAGTITINLPAGAAGSIVSMADYAGTWQTNNVTVAANGTEKIGGIDADVTLDTEGQSVTLVYVDSTQGWINTMDSTSNVRGIVPYIVASVSGTCNTLTDDGDFKVAKFINPGTFTVCCASTVTPRNGLEYLVVAGGGGGRNNKNGAARGGGGGGGGGYRTSAFGPSPLQAPTIPAVAGAYPVTVGAGGAGGTIPGAEALPGDNSVFAGPTSITSAGGGFGAGNVTTVGGPGGSGGGAGDGPSGGAAGVAGGTGNTPPVSPPQGKDGGPRNTNPNNNGGGGSGGGGAGGCGSSGQVSGPSYPKNGGAGGSGVDSDITGVNTSYANGGAGGPTAQSTPVAGTANSGNGASGGGGGYPPGSDITGAQGGSGIVVIRYKFQN